jgi:hypothetical protein
MTPEVPTTGGIDERESLWNENATGPAERIQLPLERITTLRGILFDLDPGLLAPGNQLFAPADEPRVFFASVEPALNRHALARNAEVRSSGTGLHLIVWLSPAVELKTEGEQRYWDAAVKAAQRTLPIDPDMPGVTALTRPVGSVNGKNGARVEALRQGTPVAPAEVEEFVRRVRAAPFKEIALPLVGGPRAMPCPVCRKPDSRLDVLDRVGNCYGGCSKVTGEALLGVVYRAAEPDGQDETPAGTAGKSRRRAKR